MSKGIKKGLTVDGRLLGKGAPPGLALSETYETLNIFK